MDKILLWNDINSVGLAAQAVNTNELIVGTTDTVLGLFASVCPEGKDLLDVVKQRERKPYIVLLSEKKAQELLYKLCIVDDILYSVIKNFWPGPLTIIFNVEDLFEDNFLEQETVALRVPCHVGIQRLLDQVGMVFSTSANLAGQPVPATLEGVDLSILEQARYGIVDENIIPSLPSTILKYQKNDSDQPFKMIRQGAVTIEQLIHSVGALSCLANEK